ncbi:hypothetical protein PR202_gn00466 [Eleusine coracana subsp. coracana]|uniref:Uncharacterized protein n=1 Tax=Eleusine coracana subsp. coracana TaxID=191504 RepID=A0AAV5G2P2_ELECO|nr:hypothetical protein PR202_gn00466 [Eleusine coracana subsp. coracana]
MAEQMVPVSNHQWLLLSTEMLEIMEHLKFQGLVRMGYALLTWFGKLCHSSPKLKHSIRVLHQTVPILHCRLHLIVQTEKGMVQVILGVHINIIVTEPRSLILKGKGVAVTDLLYCHLSC